MTSYSRGKESAEKARAGVGDLLVTAGQRWYAPLSRKVVDKASEAAKRLKEVLMKIREAGQ